MTLYRFCTVIFNTVLKQYWPCTVYLDSFRHTVQNYTVLVPKSSILHPHPHPYLPFKLGQRCGGILKSWEIYFKSGNNIVLIVRNRPSRLQSVHQYSDIFFFSKKNKPWIRCIHESVYFSMYNILAQLDLYKIRCQCFFVIPVDDVVTLLYNLEHSGDTAEVPLKYFGDCCR